MFTVLVTKPDNTETLYDCDSLQKEPNALIMWGSSFGPEGLQVLGPQGATMAWDWDRSRKVTEEERMRAAQADRAHLYVMNRFGKTVATYTL